MTILFLVFLTQLFVAVTCLVITETQIKEGLAQNWKVTSNETICFTENNFDCCGYADDESPDCSLTNYVILFNFLTHVNK